MKNEDRIVELLTESLKGQDVQSEKLETVSTKLDSLVDVVRDMNKALQSQLSLMNRLMEKYDKVDDLEHRIFLIEKKLKH
jgi:hypothetical protein